MMRQGEGAEPASEFSLSVLVSIRLVPTVA